MPLDALSAPAALSEDEKPEQAVPMKPEHEDFVQVLHQRLVRLAG
jgi:hypothetical protein